MATLFLMVGLPGAGKTARAKEFAAQHGALRLSPDAWMIPLFGDSEAGGKRNVLEGRLIWLALEALRLGTSVILDFGFWARDERSALEPPLAEIGIYHRRTAAHVIPTCARRTHLGTTAPGA